MNPQDGLGGARAAADGAPRLRALEPRAVREPAPIDTAALRDAVAAAREIAEEHPEPFRSLAFTALVGHLLGRNGRAAPSLSVTALREATPAAPPDTEVQIAEFLAALHHIDSHPSRVVAIAYYHQKRQDGRGVTTKDLVDAYQRARIKRPQNFPDVIASCMRRGYIVEGSRRDGMKSWTVTQSGERLIEQTV
jgi:hypothetical protein